LNISTATAPQLARTNVGAPRAIDVRDIEYSYGERKALDRLSLEVPAGAIFGLLGPNGSGKSTLLSLLIGRRQAAAGTLRVLDEPLTSRLRSRIGIVFQEPSLDPQMTVMETMRLQATLFGLRGDEGERTARRLLERVALADRANAYTSTLSGGMKRRLELARALTNSPQLLLLDEPTLALDPDSRQRLWQHLVEANADGTTLLLATNDVYEAERQCQTVALLDEGRLVAQGSPVDLKRDLRHDAVRIEWKGDPADEVSEIQLWPGVGHVRLAGRTTHVTVDYASAFLTRVFQHAGDRIHSVRVEESTLEDVYFQLVGKGITPPPDDRSQNEAM
jgi:ABC-2 type transport system ATP-binding protein